MPRKVVKKKSKKTEKSLIKREIFAITAIGLSVFFIVSIWFNSGGMAGKFLTGALRGLFGDVAFALPVFLIASGVMALIPSENKKYTKPIIIDIVPVLISMLSQLTYRLSSPAPQNGISELYKLAADGKGGGVVGGVLSEPLLWLVGSVGSFIIVISMLLIAFVMLYQTSRISSAFL
jgi:S-DNA-T family DNA segregation ATPase FtsK/SpoIIIE